MAAAKVNSDSFAFTLVWLALLSAGYSIAGTLLLRKMWAQTPLALGIMVGVTFMMAMHMITLGVLAVGDAGKTGGRASSEEAVGAFTIMLFINQLVMTVLLYLYREDLLPPNSMASQDTHVPPGGYPEYSTEGGHGPEVESDDVNIENQPGGVH